MYLKFQTTAPHHITKHPLASKKYYKGHASVLIKLYDQRKEHIATIPKTQSNPTRCFTSGLTNVRIKPKKIAGINSNILPIQIGHLFSHFISLPSPFVIIYTLFGVALCRRLQHKVYHGETVYAVTWIINNTPTAWGAAAAAVANRPKNRTPCHQNMPRRSRRLFHLSGFFRFGGSIFFYY